MLSQLQVLSDARLKVIAQIIGEVIHDDTRYAKGTLNMRTQKCFAIKVFSIIYSLIWTLKIIAGYILAIIFNFLN
jgi:hypothetical protein